MQSLYTKFKKKTVVYCVTPVSIAEVINYTKHTVNVIDNTIYTAAGTARSHQS